MIPDLIAELEDAAAQLQAAVDAHDALPDDVPGRELHTARLTLEDAYATLTAALEHLDDYEQGHRSQT